MSDPGPHFGSMTKTDVRTVWRNEQQDFTPWMAQEENISLLGDALGLELEVENTEVAVGPYSADILAKELGTGRFVVIENQFGKTNHDHLGKLITYGSVLDASAVVWLAEEFTEEHHKALDWLNDHTDDELMFYGVVLELWRIDHSRPAVRFNVVSRPPQVSRKEARDISTGELTETRRLQLEFWTEFRQQLLDTKVVSTAQQARPQYWFDVPLGRSGIFLSNIANTYDNRIGVRVYFSNKVADAALEQLAPQREDIERELGEKLKWNPRPENRDKVLVLHHAADLANRDAWPEYVDWMVTTVRKCRKAFMPRLKALDLTPAPAEDDQGPSV